MHSHITFFTATVIATCGFASQTTAAPKSMDLAALYEDSVSTDLSLPKNSKPCRVKLASLIDERRNPEMIGVYFGRAIRAPSDRDAWLNSIIAALKSRKITAAATADAEYATPVDIAVTKAWITNTDQNMSASIVFRLRLTDEAGVKTEQSYRGGASHSSFISGGPNQLQRAFNTAVSRALDAMATDIQLHCGNITL